MADVLGIMSPDNPVFIAFLFYNCLLILKMLAMSLLTSTKRIKNKGFLFYNSLLVLKMMAMSVLTARQRFKNKAFANPEDANSQKVKVKVDEGVERVRRAHLNDLENITVYFVASFGYMLTNPSTALAINLFRLFTLARFAHTFVYAVVVIPQPARALSWAVGYIITGFMAVQTAVHFY